ncbi:MAG: type II toxin-antitoxin system HicB family antitoxin [Nitrospinae bacterium]|nr:type II toxin-antitoxin system HicB family antitoxin [Nitrospinota bacterium]
MRKIREYTVVIERDEQGIFVADVPELPGCHTQAKSLDSLMDRIKEAIQLCVVAQKSTSRKSRLVGVQRISV